MYVFQVTCVRRWTYEALSFQQGSTYKLITLDFRHYLYQTDTELKELPVYKNMAYWFDISEEEETRLLKLLPNPLANALQKAFPSPPIPEPKDKYAHYQFPVICRQRYEYNRDELWSTGRTYLADTADFVNFHLTTNFEERLATPIGKSYLVKDVAHYFAIDEETRNCLKATLDPDSYNTLQSSFARTT